MELVTFPKGQFDDLVDCVAYAVLSLQETSPPFWIGGFPAAPEKEYLPPGIAVPRPSGLDVPAPPDFAGPSGTAEPGTRQAWASGVDHSRSFGTW